MFFYSFSFFRWILIHKSSLSWATIRWWSIYSISLSACSASNRVASRRVRRPRRRPPPTSRARTALAEAVPRPRGRSSRSLVDFGARAPRLPRRVQVTSGVASSNLPTANRLTVVGVVILANQLSTAATIIAAMDYFRLRARRCLNHPLPGEAMARYRSAIPAEVLPVTPAAASQAALNSPVDWSWLKLTWVIDLFCVFVLRARRSLWWLESFWIWFACAMTVRSPENGR